jgi:hypothetical protein
MAWFVAHTLMVLRPNQPIDRPLFCWENLILIEAEHDDDLWAIAEARALDVDATTEFEMHPVYDVPARWEYAGTRKIVWVRNDTIEDKLVSGDELTYNTLLFGCQEEIDRFVAGAECNVRIADDSNELPIRRSPS